MEVLLAEICDLENESMKSSLWSKLFPWAIGYAVQESLSSMPCFSDEWLPLIFLYQSLYLRRRRQSLKTMCSDSCIEILMYVSWGFCTMKAWVKLVLCCVQLSYPNITREMVSRKDWFSATVSSFHPFPACFSYLLHLVITLCCNGLRWVGSVLGFVVEHSEGQTLNYSTDKNIYLLEKELKFLIILSLWLRIGWKENYFCFLRRNVCRCMCMHVCVHVFISVKIFFHLIWVMWVTSSSSEFPYCESNQFITKLQQFVGLVVTGFAYINYVSD